MTTGRSLQSGRSAHLDQSCCSGKLRAPPYRRDPALHSFAQPHTPASSTGTGFQRSRILRWFIWEVCPRIATQLRREESMQTKRLLLGMGAGLAVMLVPAALFFVHAQNQPPTALTGHVTSEAEGAMEGVVVSAKKAGSTVTVSVVSDAQGRYSFPANRLIAGKY